MDPFVIGSLISAAGSLFGGKDEADAAREASERNYQMQKEFAQHGISWKVSDAKRAGIHPLYAIGAPTVSATPSFVGSSMGSGISRAAEQIGRGISARQDRVMAEEKQKAELDLLKAQADKVRSDMIVNMKKASDAARGKQGLRTGGSARVPLYKKVWDNLEKRYIWLPNPDLGIELPETYGSYQLVRSLGMDAKEKKVPDYMLQIKAKRAPENWDYTQWITY